MKTQVAVYEEGLFDLRGGKSFLRGQMPPLACSPPKGIVLAVTSENGWSLVLGEQNFQILSMTLRLFMVILIP